MQHEAKGLVDAGAPFEKWITAFYQQTAECTSYGLCAFYDICRDGFSPATLAAFSPNTWNPLEDQTHLNRQSITSEAGLKETYEVVA